MQSGNGFENVTTLLCGMHARIIGSHRRCDDSATFQLREIQKIKRSDARRHSVGRHASELAASKSELDNIELLDDLECETRICSRIESKGRKIVAVVMQDFFEPILHVTLDRFAFTQHITRDRSECIVVHAHECAAQQIDAIEDEPTWNGSLTAAEIAFGF